MTEDRRHDARTREVLDEVKDEARATVKGIEGDWQTAIKEIREGIDRDRAILRWAMRWLVGISFVLPFLVGGALYLFDVEANARRDQSCKITEGQQRAEVQSLRRTYSYLLSLSTKERRDPINRAVLAGLPTQEAQARQDNAPAFCDDPGYGEPEPDPVVPRRPAALR